MREPTIKERIKICKRNESGSLTILGEKRLVVWLDEKEMVLYTKYNRRDYEVNGSLEHQYIVVE